MSSSRLATPHSSSYPSLMDLQTFVRETLVEIVAGVAQAQNEVRQYKSLINPPLSPAAPKDKVLAHGVPEADRTVLANANLIATGMGVAADMVEFDIALTVSESKSETSEREGGAQVAAKLHIAEVHIGGTAKGSTQSDQSGSSVSRVKFRIPVVFPQL